MTGTDCESSRLFLDGGPPFQTLGRMRDAGRRTEAP